MQCRAFVLAFAALAVSYSHFAEGSAPGRSKRTFESLPIMASVRFMGRHRCSGAIVSERIVLTAAQCVQKSNIGYLDVVVGHSSKVHKVLNVAVHPKYDPWNQDYNFAVIKVKTPFELGESAAPVPLATHPFGNASRLDPAISAEWGSQVREVFLDASAASALDCSSVHQVTSRMICVEARGLKGDIGSPLLYEGQLHGVLSAAYGEAEVGVYARAYPYASSFVAAQMSKDPMEDDICAALQVIVEALQGMWFIPDFIISAVQFVRDLMKCNV